jgi:hypothetical protein
MQTQEFRIIYNVLNEGYGVAPFFLGLISISLTVAIYFQTVSFFESDIFKKELRDFPPLIMLPIMLVVSVFSSVNIFQVRKDCLDRANNGEFSVTQGVVKNLVRRSKSESFSVNSHNFEYSRHDMTKCGFNEMELIKDGTHVRISFANESILKLEVIK